MYHGGTVLRGLWKQKPPVWGPPSVVRACLIKYFESLGIAQNELFGVFPHWCSGQQTNYINNNVATNYGAVYQNEGLYFNGAASLYYPYFNTGAGKDFTLFQVIKPTVTQSGVVQTVSNHVNQLNYSHVSDDFLGAFSMYAGVWISSGGPNVIDANTVSTFCGMCNGTSISTHINGALSSSMAVTVTPTIPQIGYRIGSGVTTINNSTSISFFNGYVLLTLIINKALTNDQIVALNDYPYALIQPPVFRSYSIPSGTPTILNLADIAQAQTIDKLDLIQQAILAINSIDQSQVIDNITLSLSQNLIIAGISQSQIIDNIGLIQQISLLINSLQQNQVINVNDLIQQSLLSIQELSQAQVIDNLTLLSATILTIAELNQSQEVDNLSLIQQSAIAIADIAQIQDVDNIVLLYGNVLVITGISQGQTSDNISLVQQNLLSVADINQVQTTDSVTLSVAGLLEIANLVQTQNLDVINLQQNFALAIDSLFQTQDMSNIILDSNQILAIQQLVQTQLVDVISLVQQSVLNVDEISQQQILDNIEIVITRISGKLSITFQLKTPGGRFQLETSDGKFILR